MRFGYSAFNNRYKAVVVCSDKKSTGLKISGAFIFFQKRLMVSLSTFPSLMSCLGQKLAVFVLSHLFSAFFNNTTQLITSFSS
jgi:hypothetical protein